MKKYVVVFLILVGFAFGCWLALENRKLFELPHRAEQFEKSINHGIIAGMENWQVKEVLGPPEKRNVMLANQQVREEEWIYAKRCLYFKNGILTSWRERQGSSKEVSNGKPADE